MDDPNMTPSGDPLVPPKVPLVLDGRQHESRTTHWLDVRNPATQRIVANVPVTTPAELNTAVQTGKAAQPAWAKRPLSSRVRTMFLFQEAIRENLDELSMLITQEQGKTLDDSVDDILRGLEVVEQACAAGTALMGSTMPNVARGVDCQSVRVPLGVCACVCPQLFPAMLPLWTIPLAIVAGNAVVLKPSEGAPSAGVMLAELAMQAGVPSGVLNVVHGGQSTVDLLVSHPDVKAVSFLGSSKVGQKVYRTATTHGKRVQASMTSKNHSVILPDAPMELAADAIARAAFQSLGQRSMSLSVLVLVGDAKEKFMPLLLDHARKLKVNAGHEPGADIGPIGTAWAKEYTEAQVLDAINAGATLELDGRGVKVPGYDKGNFMGPTVLSGVTPAMKCYREEVHGPVLLVMHAEALEDAIQYINDNEQAGMGCSIFTSSPFAARSFRHQVESGMVGINIATPTPPPFFSFTGWRKSFAGDHHMNGTEGIHFYTQQKTIVSRRVPRGPCRSAVGARERRG